MVFKRFETDGSLNFVVNRRTIRDKMIAIYLALTGVLGWSFIDKAKADWISPTPRNLIVSPVYSFIPINIWHQALDGSEEAIENIKKWFKNFLKEKLWSKNVNLNYINLTDELTEFLLEIYKSNKDIIFEDFINKYLQIFQKYNISSKDALLILIQMIEKGLIPDEILQNIDVSNKLYITLDDIKNFYWKQEFDKKLRKIVNLSLKWQLTVDKIKQILSDYLQYKKRTFYIEWFLLFKICFNNLLIF